MKVGDLVYVCRTCDCKNGAGWLGTFGCVESVGVESRCTCSYCGKRWGNHVVVNVSLRAGATGVFPRSWLRRIPPIEELEQQQQTEEQPA